MSESLPPFPKIYQTFRMAATGTDLLAAVDDFEYFSGLRDVAGQLDHGQMWAGQAALVWSSGVRGMGAAMDVLGEVVAQLATDFEALQEDLDDLRDRYEDARTAAERARRDENDLRGALGGSHADLVLACGPLAGRAEMLGYDLGDEEDLRLFARETAEYLDGEASRLEAEATRVRRELAEVAQSYGRRFEELAVRAAERSWPISEPVEIHLDQALGGVDPMTAAARAQEDAALAAAVNDREMRLYIEGLADAGTGGRLGRNQEHPDPNGPFYVDDFGP